MKLNKDNKQFIEYLSNISGVDRDSVTKVFQAYILAVILELYEKLENYDKTEHYYEILEECKREDVTYEDINNKILEVTNKVKQAEDYAGVDVLINETIELKLPFFLNTLKLNVEEKPVKGGIGFNLDIKAIPSNFLIDNIRQILNNEKPNIIEDIKLEIFDCLDKIANKR